MIPPKLAPIVFGFVVSGIMSFLVTLVATIRTLGIVDGFVGIWMSSWILAWLVAFPTIVIVAPKVRGIVERNTRKPAA